MKWLKRILCPESYKYGVECDVCNASFSNLNEHEQHIMNFNLQGNHKNSKIKIIKK